MGWLLPIVGKFDRHRIPTIPSDSLLFDPSTSDGPLSDDGHGNPIDPIPMCELTRDLTRRPTDRGRHRILRHVRSIRASIGSS